MPGGFALDLAGKILCSLMVIGLVVVLLCEEPEAMLSIPTCGSNNKAGGPCELHLLDVHTPSSTGRGGEGRERSVCLLGVRALRRREDTAAPSSCSTVVPCRPLICDDHGWHLQTPWTCLSNLQQRRPLIDGATATLFTLFFPSGVVPGVEDGGRRWHPSLELHGEAEAGLDCFSSNLSLSSSSSPPPPPPPPPRPISDSIRSIYTILSSRSAMRKRERENPCGICGHYHKYEEGEPCGVCGHRPPVLAGAPRQDSAFPSEVLRDFLFLGSYDNASRSELLKTVGISHILNTVPFCQNLYRNSFTYHCLQDDKTLQFDDAIQFLEQCERDKARVLVHCMSGKSRSAAFVIAFLMKSRGWRLAQCFQWVKERRPQVQLADAAQQQLIEYEQKLFGSNVGVAAQFFTPTDSAFPSLGFGFPKPSGDIQVPTFNQQAPASIFERVSPNNIPSNFTFGAEGIPEVKLPDNGNFSVANLSGSDGMMDSS